MPQQDRQARDTIPVPKYQAESIEEFERLIKKKRPTAAFAHAVEEHENLRYTDVALGIILSAGAFLLLFWKPKSKAASMAGDPIEQTWNEFQ